MSPTGEPITALTLDSSPIEFDRATLVRGDTSLTSGLPGSPRWHVEVEGARLPAGHLEEDVRVELTADGVSYSGAGRLDEGGSDGPATIIGNGPLIAHTRVR